ncbi:MAG: cytochrome c biogenesis protein CcdA, partial [Halobacteriota archaeon]|nr:cytochrome c biogenesis protein CcdA [Halobacteriota archaeon]
VLLGFFATLVELPCTGGIYLPVLTLLSQEPSKALFYLTIYNLVYILPLIVIILITYYGMEIEEAEGWRKNSRRYMRLAGGLVMILIGLGMLFGVF